MASKRKGKEIETSGSGAGKKQSTVRNHGINFKDPEQRSRYTMMGMMVMMVVMKRRKVHTYTMSKKSVGTMIMNGGHGCKPKFNE